MKWLEMVGDVIFFSPAPLLFVGWIKWSERLNPLAAGDRMELRLDSGLHRSPAFACMASVSTCGNLTLATGMNTWWRLNGECSTGRRP